MQHLPNVEHMLNAINKDHEPPDAMYYIPIQLRKYVHVCMYRYVCVKRIVREMRLL